MEKLKSTAADYRIEQINDLSTVKAHEWDALVRDACGRLHPALRHSFLDGLHRTGCASPDTGWEPRYLLAWHHDALMGAVPLYRKHHSYGEYVFDWSWAEAHHKHGLNYYPKLLAAIPFTPVSAPKLLARDEPTRRVLGAVLDEVLRESKASSLHALFVSDEERALLENAGYMHRRNVQFHWQNAGYASFDEFLAQLDGPKRRKIRAERRKVRDASVTLRTVLGSQAHATDWDFFTRCYERTYREHHSMPYLNRAFFGYIGATMGEQVLLVIAERAGKPIAATLSLFDETTLYGRYWGAIEHIPCLHFEACYYAPIEFCIARGIQVFEGGAQGEHKLARGFTPAEMTSMHRVAHPMFAEAIERFLRYESVGVDGYLDELNDRNPYRAGTFDRTLD
ncbi:MAG TPA: GNAT family N-acetyltransferase [Burkholderiaceae bacterium]|nr:GNAT family N-acetyltransferase [Burkholderiaceae bacterium]